MTRPAESVDGSPVAGGPSHGCPVLVGTLANYGRCDLPTPYAVCSFHRAYGGGLPLDPSDLSPDKTAASRRVAKARGHD